MGEVEAFEVDGIKCYFPSADHLPHHFEVYRRGAYVVRIYFLRTNRKRGLNWDYKRNMGGEFAPAEQAVLFELVMKHKRRLLAEWRRKVSPDQRK
ncbi:MAG TPA: hypothetical protein VFJ16_19915 [Longimicrobium sp.]|nr:hypothetical protein [Longimicrobium sp.]